MNVCTQTFRFVACAICVIGLAFFTSPALSNGDGDGKGQNKNGSDSKNNCGRALEMHNQQEMLWKINNRELGNRWPSGLQPEMFEEKKTIELSRFAEAYPDIVELTITACNGQAMTFSREDMLTGHRHYLMLNNRKFWKLTQQDGGTRTRNLLMNIKLLTVKKKPLPKNEE